MKFKIKREELLQIGNFDTWSKSSHTMLGPTSTLARAVRILHLDARTREQAVASFGGRDAFSEFLRSFHEALNAAQEKSKTKSNFEFIYQGLQEEYGQAVQQAQSTISALTAHLERLCGQVASTTESEDSLPKTSRLGILLVSTGRESHNAPGQTRSAVPNQIESAVVGELNIARCNHAREIELRPGSIGLTALSEGDDGFLDGTRNAWQVASFTNGDGFQWWLDSVDNCTFPNYQRLHDRSCEAAFVCGLWAAAGGIPGEPAIGDDSLDDMGAVTAMLDKSNLCGRMTRLFPVAGFPAKVAAAVQHGRLLIVAAKEQLDNRPAGREKTDRQLIDPQHLQYIAEVDTVGEAFDELLLSSRVARKHRENRLNAWNAKFYEVDDKGQPIQQPQP